MNNIENEILLTTAEVSEILKIDVGTLQNWRNQKKHLPYIKLSKKCIRYQKTDIEKYIFYSEIKEQLKDDNILNSMIENKIDFTPMHLLMISDYKIFNITNSLFLIKEIEKFQNNNKFLGFFYIIEYNDYIKIGSTMNPTNRISDLKNQAISHKRLIKKIILSKPHFNFLENEKYLLNSVKEYLINGEYFNTTFDNIKHYINDLSFNVDIKQYQNNDSKDNKNIFIEMIKSEEFRNQLKDKNIIKI
jgi:hypothetical protein